MAAPTVSQIAANLNLRFYTKYPFSFTLTFPDTDLTHYTLAAYLQDHRDQKVVDFTITPITLNPGYLTLSLTDEQVARLDKKASYQWVFDWTPLRGEKRRIVAGRAVIMS